GDASGIEEASTAMLEGRLAGLCAAESLGKKAASGKREEIIDQIRELRAGPFGEKARRGKEKMSREAWSHVQQKR
ncbi:pyridine nucleotide-disulfide oxidoreductase, partial [bacterium]|nr:pyridine nucleotide-disulfide oxidoreductase [bacterium]